MSTLGVSLMFYLPRRVICFVCVYTPWPLSSQCNPRHCTAAQRRVCLADQCAFLMHCNAVFLSRDSFLSLCDITSYRQHSRSGKDPFLVVKTISKLIGLSEKWAFTNSINVRDILTSSYLEFLSPSSELQELVDLCLDPPVPVLLPWDHQDPGGLLLQL